MVENVFASLSFTNPDIVMTYTWCSIWECEEGWLNLLFIDHRPYYVPLLNHRTASVKVYEFFSLPIPEKS